MPTTFEGFARHLPTKKKSNTHHLPTHFFRFLVKASYGFARANPHKIFSLAPKGQATGTACSSLKFHFCLLGIPKTFCVVALEMKNKRAARNRAHLHIMFHDVVLKPFYCCRNKNKNSCQNFHSIKDKSQYLPRYMLVVIRFFFYLRPLKD